MTEALTCQCEKCVETRALVRASLEYLKPPLYGRIAVSVKDKNWREQLRAPIIDAKPK